MRLRVIAAMLDYFPCLHYKDHDDKALLHA